MEQEYRIDDPRSAEQIWGPSHLQRALMERETGETTRWMKYMYDLWMEDQAQKEWDS